MKFGSIALKDTCGAVLAHRLGPFKKGHVLTDQDITTLHQLGITTVTVAQLAVDDVPENQAADAIANALVGAGTIAYAAATGRANLYATHAGLLRVDAAQVLRANQIHESLTCATLQDFAEVKSKQMLATVKVIPFAAPKSALDQCLAILSSSATMQVLPYRKIRVQLIITEVADTKKNLTTKSETAMRQRIEALGGELSRVVVCNHDAEAVAHEIRQCADHPHDLILLFGAVAIVDRGDVLPAALTMVGGEVQHLGMPVDPGNLLMLAKLNGKPVIGVPTCARSPKENGFDWVLQRIACGIDVSPQDIQAMGVGGLLTEISTRPMPRDQTNKAQQIIAIVLAAGMSSRMGSNKMLALVDGVPMIRKTVERILQSNVDEVVVVLGNQAEEVRATLEGLDLRFVTNPEYASGLASSLRHGVKAAKDADAVIVCLGDMPLLDPASIDQLIATFEPEHGISIVVPKHAGKIGNPLLWGKKHFAKLQALTGDQGARSLLAELGAEIIEIELNDPGIHIDVDTQEALRTIRA